MTRLIAFEYSDVAMWHCFNANQPRIWWLPSWLISFDRTWRGLCSVLVVFTLPGRDPAEPLVWDFSI